MTDQDAESVHQAISFIEALKGREGVESADWKCRRTISAQNWVLYKALPIIVMKKVCHVGHSVWRLSP